MNESKKNLRDFYKCILDTKLEKFMHEFAVVLNDWESKVSKKDVARWEKQLEKLPEINDCSVNIDSVVSLISNSETSILEPEKTKAVLKNFMPWRKGPFNFFGIDIDTEWRSDLKWNRVLPHLSNLQNSNVLDVGCGSGYHLFRMHQADAKQVIGIDPTLLFYYQFRCFKRYLSQLNVHFLPLAMENMPITGYFDKVFCMGVLYHRADPIGFLKLLKQQLFTNGELILETLIVDGDEQTVLVPKGRYAQMSNVWFIPSVKALTLWLHKVGFSMVECVDIDQTSIEEQRSTEWMQNHSLADFLDPSNPDLTIEGYDAPKRAVFVARV